MIFKAENVYLALPSDTNSLSGRAADYFSITGNKQRLLASIHFLSFPGLEAQVCKQIQHTYYLSICIYSGVTKAVVPSSSKAET